jgi:hypothetical protein
VIPLKTDALGNVTTNVELIKSQLFTVLNSDDYEAVHIIGHSKGGIESIELKKDPIFSEKISTIILLNSPIYGDSFSTKITAHRKPSSRVFKSLNFFGRIQGDKHPDAYSAFKDLSVNHMVDLIPGKTNFYILQTRYGFKDLNFPWNYFSLLAYGKNTEGDGLVEYKDVIEDYFKIILPHKLTDRVLTHNGATGLPRYFIRSRVDVTSFWDNLLTATIGLPENNKYIKGNVLHI